MQSLNALPWVPGLPFSAFDFRETDDAFGQPQIPSPFTEFYCTSGGSNLNAGSTTDNAAIYTSTNGAWSTVTNTFTPTDSSNPVASGVSAGMFVSIFLDAASVAVYIARITSVTGTVNAAIAVSSTVIYGTAPTTAASGITVKVGGAWLGPNGATLFPFGLSGTIGALINTSSNQVRLNIKNDQTYTMTAALAFTSLGAAVMQGYTSSPGDLGKVNFTSNLTTASNFTTAATTGAFVDLNFASTAASSTRDVFTNSGNGIVFLRCVFHGGMGNGLSNSGTFAAVLECEAYDCNKANSANTAGFLAGGGSAAAILFYNCYSHDHTGSNGHGFEVSSGSAGIAGILINCVADTVGGIGLLENTTVAAFPLISINSNYYNGTSDAIKIQAQAGLPWNVIINNHFVKNSGAAINNTVTSSGGIMYNNGRANNSLPDTLKSIVNTGTDKFYPYGVTPWNSPATGDFSTILPAAIGTGRGAFTETDGTNTGTVGYLDIGAAQSQPFTQSWAGEDYILPVGYLTHVYEIDFTFNSTVAISLLSGSLPTGLSLSTVSPTQAKILGTPTVLGTYDFTLRSTVGASTGDATFHITVLSASASAFNPLAPIIITPARVT